MEIQNKKIEMENKVRCLFNEPWIMNWNVGFLEDLILNIIFK